MARQDRDKPITIERAAQILTNGTAYRHNVQTLFRDFVAATTIALRNAHEPFGEEWDKREAEYLEIVGRYEREVILQFKDCLTALITLAYDYADLLGSLYMSLNIGSKAMGQFFTPYHMSQLMAMLVHDRPSIERAIAENGYIGVNEPTCGAGGMVIASAEAIRGLGFDPTQHMRVTAQDIDIVCCQMTYLNCTFFGIPATIIHGDVIRLEERSVMKTPALLALERQSQPAAA